MSDMTDAAKLRLLVEWFDEDDKRRGRAAHHRQVQEDLEAIADRLDAMQWREKPPDSNGDWIRRRDKRVDTTFPFKRCFGQTFIADYHHPGDLWFKIPEVPK